MFARLGGSEILLILGIGFLFFGPKKLPEIGKAFGETIKEFKKSANDELKIEAVNENSK